MAHAKTLPNLQALRSPSPAQTLPSEAVLDALKMILIGASLNEVLTSVTRLIEAHSEGMLCSIFLLDEDGLHLRYGGAANLPEAYRAATDGVCIGPNVGSCGATCRKRTGRQLMECALVRMSDRAAQRLTFGSQFSSPTSFLTRIGPA